MDYGLLKHRFPVIDTEEVGAVEVCRAFRVEVVVPLLAVGVGREDQFPFARKSLVEVGHVEVLIGTRAEFVEHPGHRPQLMTLLKRSPGIVATHDIELFGEDVTLCRHVVPIAFLEDPSCRDAAGTDG